MQKHLEHFSQTKFPSCGGMATLSWCLDTALCFPSFISVCPSFPHQEWQWNNAGTDLLLHLGRGGLGSQSGFPPFPASYNWAPNLLQLLSNCKQKL